VLDGALYENMNRPPDPGATLTNPSTVKGVVGKRKPNRRANSMVVPPGKWIDCGPDEAGASTAEPAPHVLDSPGAARPPKMEKSCDWVPESNPNRSESLKQKLDHSEVPSAAGGVPPASVLICEMVS
jgi:hypothetical protein